MLGHRDRIVLAGHVPGDGIDHLVGQAGLGQVDHLDAEVRRFGHDDQRGLESAGLDQSVYHAFARGLGLGTHLFNGFMGRETHVEHGFEQKIVFGSHGVLRIFRQPCSGERWPREEVRVS